jgi:hypothetical protein
MKHEAEISIDKTGHGTVKLDGRNIEEGVRSMRLDIEPRQVPVLYLEMMPDRTLFDGDVEVVRSIDDNLLKHSMVKVLQSIDPKQLEQLALEDADFSTSSGEAFLGALIKLLEEATR